MRERIENICFRIGKIIWLPTILVGSWFVHSGYESMGEVLNCYFLKTCGFPCPGCGGTRAIYYLFQGNIGMSFLYHPAVLYSILAYFHFMGRMILGKRNPKFRIEWYFYGLAILIIVQWILKIAYILF